MNILLLLSALFLGTLLLGRLLEYARIPWIFASLLLGLAVSWFQPLKQITSTEAFSFLSDIGMYFLLFVVGMDINLQTLRKRSQSILKTTATVITLEALVGGVVLHLLFGIDLKIAIIVALSFATVGEAILVPILDEYSLVNTRIGQSIIGIGSLDDLLELLMLIAVACMAGNALHGESIALILTALLALVVLTGALLLFRPRKPTSFFFRNIQTSFLLTLFVFCLLVGIGELAHAAPVAATLSGLIIRNFLPHKRYLAIESEIKTMCYGFFAPVFFFSIGISIEPALLLQSTGLIVLIFILSAAMKIIGSIVAMRKEVGVRMCVLLGIGLSVRFSTSIIVVRILREYHLIDDRLYGVMIASSVLLTVAVPVAFSRLIVRWQHYLR